ncbi:hypothetical protein SDC9_154977 [bioreactor metagenome]|uniref:Uncharacterized protein n=1 Tax=bioreactor metagenome TaxID=1076179 RepID=A0A645F219_9ZZZZ
MGLDKRCGVLNIQLLIEQQPLHRLRLVFARCEQQKLFRAEDISHPHRDRARRNLVPRCKESRVRIDRTLVELFHMRAVIEHPPRLVKADVPIHANAEQLHIDGLLRQCIAECLDVRFDIPGSPGNDGVFLVDVDMVEEILVHKPAITLRMIRREADIFIQIDGVHM